MLQPNMFSFCGSLLISTGCKFLFFCCIYFQFCSYYISSMLFFCCCCSSTMFFFVCAAGNENDLKMPGFETSDFQTKLLPRRPSICRDKWHKCTFKISGWKQLQITALTVGSTGHVSVGRTFPRGHMSQEHGLWGTMDVCSKTFLWAIGLINLSLTGRSQRVPKSRGNPSPHSFPGEKRAARLRGHTAEYEQMSWWSSSRPYQVSSNLSICVESSYIQ